MSDRATNKKKRSIDDALALSSPPPSTTSVLSLSGSGQHHHPLDPSSTTVGIPTTYSTNITILHQQQQLASLQAELEHERAARALDGKKHQHAVRKLEQQVVLAVRDANSARELMQDVTDQSERRVQQLTQDRDRALQLNRQLQMQLEEVEQDLEEQTQPAANVQHYQRENERLQEQVAAQEENEVAFRAQVEQLKREMEAQLREARTTATTAASAHHPLLEEAPSAVLKELNRTRIQLAEAERRDRQLQREKESITARNRQLIRDGEKYQQQAQRLPVVERDVQRLNRQYEEAAAELRAWQEFAQQLSNVIRSGSSGSSSAGAGGGPPEVATVIRFLETAQRESASAQQSAAHYKTECERLRKNLGTVERAEDESSLSLSGRKQREWEIRLETANQELQTAKQQAALYQREADSLRTLIQTFEKQMEQRGLLVKDLDHPAHQTLQVQLQTANDQVALLQSQHDSLVADLQTSRTEHATVQQELEDVREKYGKLRAALTGEKEKVTAAEQRAVAAEQLAGQGSFDPARTRVWHLTETPLVQALKEEVAVLKRQLEVALSSSSSKKQQKSTPGSSAKGGGASTMAADPDKLNQRLKENFKEQIGTFSTVRGVCW